MPYEYDYDEERPDAQYIETCVAHLEDIWQETHRNWERVDLYYHREVALWSDDERDARGDMPEYHPARATATIDHAVDSQLAYEPRVERFPTSSTEKDKRDADHVEPFVQAVFQEAALLEPVLTWKQVGKHLLMYGYSVVEGPVLATGGRPDKPKRKRSESDEAFEHRMTLWQNAYKTWMPFRIRAPHPAHVLLEPTNKRPREGVKVVDRYAIDVERLSKERMKRKQKDAFVKEFEADDDPYRLVHCYEYWSYEWHALMADNDLIFVEPNTWGYLPFKHAFAGFGQLRTNSRSVEVKYLAVGLIDPIMDSLKLQAQALSGIHNTLIDASFPDRYVRGNAEDIRNQKARGARYIQLGPNDAVDFEAPPAITRWMFEAEKLVDFDIEYGTFSRNLAGLRQIGTYTVGQTAIQMNAAEKKFIATGQQMEHLATAVGQDILRCVELLDEPLTVRGHTIRPSDISHDYSLEVKFEIIDPVLELQRRQVLAGEVQSGLASRTKFWRETKEPNASEEKLNILYDELFRDPTIRQAFVQEMARKFGLIPLLEQAQKQRQEPSGLVSPNGEPLGPSGLTPSVPNPTLRSQPGAGAPPSDVGGY